jgi:hypothetical protein
VHSNERNSKLKIDSELMSAENGYGKDTLMVQDTDCTI